MNIKNIILLYIGFLIIPLKLLAAESVHTVGLKSDNHAIALSKNSEDNKYNIENALFDYLRPILRSGNFVGRLNYKVSCENDQSEALELPQINSSSLDGGSISSQIKSIFKDDKVAVKQNGNIIHITVGDPAVNILQTKISNINLSVAEMYNPDPAIEAVENSKEVVSIMRRMELHVPITFFFEAVQAPLARARRLPKSMKNLTVDAILDSIATTFNGVVVYGVCSKPNGTGLLYIHFVGLGP